VTPVELVNSIEQSGGLVALECDGERLRVRLPRIEAARLKAELRAMKPQIVALLRRRTVVYVDIACICDQDRRPHFRHREVTQRVQEGE